MLRDTGRLQAFLAVAEAGSFTRAAGRLGQSQPTTSSLVAGLERAVGAPLLLRGRGGVRLTPAGAALRAHARHLLDAAEAAQRAVDDAARPERRRLRLGGGEVLMTHVAPRALARLRERLPALEADLLVGDEPAVLAALREARIDAALVTDRAAAPDLVLEAFARDRLVLAVPEGHALASRRAGVKRVGRETLVVRSAGAVDRRAGDAWLEQHGVEPAARLVAATGEAVVRCVAAGLGVALVPGVALAGAPAGVATATLTGAPRLQYCLATRKGDAPALADALLSAL